MVLEALGKHGDVSLSDVARETSLTCSTTFRLLETLRQKGYVRQDDATGRYRLGAGALQIGASYISNQPLPGLANAAMQQLVDVTGETANLAVLSGVQSVYVHQVESQRSVRMFTQLGAHVPVHCTGVGKALLAWWTSERVTELLAKTPFKVFTENTIQDLKSFLVELETVRRLGFAVDDEERELGIRCVTAPIRDARGDVVAALSVSSPISRLPKKLISQRAKDVRSSADEISTRLGYVEK